MSRHYRWCHHAYRWLGTVRLAFLITLVLLVSSATANPPAASLRFQSDLVRESQFKFGIRAPVPMFAAQIEQESGWRQDVTAWDNGRGLAQFMDPTADWVAKKYGLGNADPYNPKWAMRAMVQLNKHNYDRVEGNTDCDKWGAGLKAYNAGLGYVQKAQQRSGEPGKWFGNTEFVLTTQSQKNFEYSRMYPRWIIFKRQPKYAAWGSVTCANLE